MQKSISSDKKANRRGIQNSSEGLWRGNLVDWLNRISCDDFDDNLSFGITMRKQIFLLALGFFLAFLIGEAGIRFYASAMNITLGATDQEREEKERYYGLVTGSLPSKFWYGGDWIWDFDPLPGQVPKPNHQCDLWLRVVKTFNKTHKIMFHLQGININSQGMRQLTEVINKKNEKMRIAFLGDSFTWGDDVVTALTYPSLFQAMLPETEILNFGRGGAGLAHMYLTFFNKTVAYNPDMLVMTIFIHDLARDLPQPFRPYLSVNETGELVVSNIPLPTHEEFLQRYTPPKLESALVDFITYTFLRSGKEKQAYAYGMTLVRPVVRELQRAMRDGTFIVAFLPFAPDDDPDPVANEERYQQLIQMLEEEKIPYVDGKKVFAKEAVNYGNNINNFYYRGGHLNPLGNALFARALVLELHAQGLAPKANIPFSFIQSKDHTSVYFLDEKGQQTQVVTGYTMQIVPKEEERKMGYESFAPLKIWCGFETAKRELEAKTNGLMLERRHLANLSK